MIRTNPRDKSIEFIPGPPVYRFANYGAFLKWIVEMHNTVCAELDLPHNLQSVKETLNETDPG